MINPLAGWAALAAVVVLAGACFGAYRHGVGVGRADVRQEYAEAARKEKEAQVARNAEYERVAQERDKAQERVAELVESARAVNPARLVTEVSNEDGTVSCFDRSVEYRMRYNAIAEGRVVRAEDATSEMPRAAEDDATVPPP